ncbi:MAG: hypothetical protein ACLSVD_01270 [Eggerthellaceae bacterium]
MDLAPEQKLHGFTVRTREELPEIDGTAYVLDHDKSGAAAVPAKRRQQGVLHRVQAYLPTTRACSILEHSVLCGSDKFPSRSRSSTC